MPRPFFTPSNPLYNEMDGESFHLLMGALKTIAQVLKVNEEDSHALLSDDMLIWFRNLGFLKDERFKKACEGFESSAFIRAKLYRVYTYCWAVEQASRTFLKGSFLDFGTYDGKTVQIADRYCPEQTWALFDTFDHHPSQEDKLKHGSSLVDEVRRRVPTASVIQGLLPDSLFDDWRMKTISFMHLDLNDAKVERQVLTKLYHRLVDGAVILIDDFGWSKYRGTYNAHKRFFERRNQSVLELPTGAGLVIKR